MIFMRTVKALIRLGGSESSLGTQVFLLVLPCAGSNNSNTHRLVMVISGGSLLRCQKAGHC